MEIYINNEKLKFQLENENNLKEVIEGVNDWLFKNLKVIDSIVIDGKVFTGEIQELSEQPIEKIKKLNLTITDIKQLIQNSLSETKNYLKEIHHYLDSKDDFTEEDLKRISSGLNWLINIFTRINNICNYEKTFISDDFNFKNEMDYLKNTNNEIDKHFTAKNFTGVAKLIKKDLITHINNWFHNIDKLMEMQPAPTENINSIREKVSGQIYKIIKKIPDMQKLIEMTAMDIQTGHEKEAMANIQIISGTLESITALLHLIKSTFSLDYNNITFENSPVETFNQQLTKVLKELLEAMKIKDTVLMSDLLTYELSPKIEQYGEILKVIAREINIEIN